ncbi:hypothetical protein LGM65_13435 [Burkholderia anthina]|uniref:hypothetical protein n=1 Tax=Burkholderia anthina TaxID=179879 RepID=UPI001CF199E7|nr:hypothetical protein [Burkholderia anthina]MCA8091885.1 hypothetical protein [Burkholderia anthina]
MKILVDRCMAFVESKHHAIAVPPACAPMTPRAACWISSEMEQKQHTARRATTLLYFQQNDWYACTRPGSFGRRFRRKPLPGRPERPLARLLRSTGSRTADSRRHRPDARHRARPHA